MDTEREWHVSEIPQGSETGYAIYDQHDPTGRDIAILYAAPGAKENAQLIAAAPDLLNALRTLVEMHDEEPSQLTVVDWRYARAAIGKAGGWDS